MKNKKIYWESIWQSSLFTLFARIFLVFGSSALITATMSSFNSEHLEPSHFLVGEVASRTVRSPKDFSVEDIIATEHNAEEAELRVPYVFVIEDREESSSENHVGRFFSELVVLAGSSAQKEILEIDPSGKENIEQHFKITFTEEEWAYLLQKKNWEILRRTVVDLLSPVFSRGIISNKKFLNSIVESRKAKLISLSGSTEVNSFRPERVYDLAEAIDVINSAFPPQGFKQGAIFDSIAQKLLKALLVANVYYDNKETENGIAAAKARAHKVYLEVKRGEVIVRAGDLIDFNQLQKLNYLLDLQLSRAGIKGWFSNLFLCAVCLFWVSRFSVFFLREFTPTNRDWAVLASALVGSFLLFKIHLILAASLGFYFPDVQTTAFIPGTPLAAGGMVIQSILGAQSVLVYVICYSAISSLFLGGEWLAIFLILIGNIAGALCVQRCARRSALIFAGVRIAVINSFISLCYLLLSPDYTTDDALVLVSCAIIGGFLSSVLGAGLTPIAEFIGGYVTDIKLLELASLDRPLLRELSISAPGTWNHSIVMGQMAELAADAIGANGVLARVGAYYHDIGKIKKPEYFVENQAGKENRHDKLTPSMSVLIIKAHVKDGIELAKQHRLPRQIVSFIPEHHGTSLIKYFYDKALKDADEEESVVESNFRYLGPKPQSREAGILMLADSVEASSRILSDPSPAKIQGLVQRTINRVFVSGELEESNLTLKDLHVIAKSFTRVLSGIYHKRIEYSEPVEKLRNSKHEQNGEDNAEEQKSSSEDGNLSTNRSLSARDGQGEQTERESEKKDEETLKRLGMYNDSAK